MSADTPVVSPAVGLSETRGLPLSLGLQPEIEPWLAARRARLGGDCISELSFSNLYLFRDVHRYRYFPGDWPYIAGHTYDGASHVMPLFDLAAAPGAVLVELLAGRDCFYPFAAGEITALASQNFVWTHVRDDADYRYPSRIFRGYDGNGLRKKRQAIAQLQARHAITWEPLAEADSRERLEENPDANPDANLDANREAARQILQGWMRDKGNQPNEADEAACIEALDNLRRFGLEGWLFRAGGKPAGFVLAQALAPLTMAMRFAKGLNAYPGIYPYMFQTCCQHWGESVAWVNFEQDLGNPNFRRTKLSFQPDSLLEKFRLHLRR